MISTIFGGMAGPMPVPLRKWAMPRNSSRTSSRAGMVTDAQNAEFCTLAICSPFCFTWLSVCGSSPTQLTSSAFRSSKVADRLIDQQTGTVLTIGDPYPNPATGNTKVAIIANKSMQVKIRIG